MAESERVLGCSGKQWDLLLVSFGIMSESKFCHKLCFFTFQMLCVNLKLVNRFCNLVSFYVFKSGCCVEENVRSMRTGV